MFSGTNLSLILTDHAQEQILPLNDDYYISEMQVCGYCSSRSHLKGPRMESSRQVVEISYLNLDVMADIGWSLS